MGTGKAKNGKSTLPRVGDAQMDIMKRKRNDFHLGRHAMLLSQSKKQKPGHTGIRGRGEFNAILAAGLNQGR